MTTDKVAKEYDLNERISISRRLIHSARGLGSHLVPVSPSVMSKLYWSVMVPRFTYGLEVCHLSDCYLYVLEAAHRQNAKLIQGLPISTPNPAPLATLGWLSRSGFLALKQILFIWKIMCLSKENQYRRVVTTLLNKVADDGKVPYTSPVYDMYSSVCRYGLESVFMCVVRSAEPVNYLYWKRVIKQVVWQAEVYRWKASCLLYPELSIYSKHVPHIQLNVWWKFLIKCPQYFRKVSAIMSLLCGTQPKPLQRNLEYHKSSCVLCKLRVKDDIYHVMIYCEKMTMHREMFWSRIFDEMPLAMKNNLQEMPQQRSIDLIISGLGGSYVDEWEKIYANIAVQTWNIYEKRAWEIDKLSQ